MGCSTGSSVGGDPVALGALSLAEETLQASKPRRLTAIICVWILVFYWTAVKVDERRFELEKTS